MALVGLEYLNRVKTTIYREECRKDWLRLSLNYGMDRLTWVAEIRYEND
jgi:hypothetical protein